MQRENILKILIKPSNNIFEKHLYPHKSVWHWYLKIRPYHLHSIFLGCMELSMVISTHSSIYPWICPSAFAAMILKFFQNLHVRNFIDQSSSFLHHFKILHKVCKQHLQIINSFLVMSVKDFRHQTLKHRCMILHMPSWENWTSLKCEKWKDLKFQYQQFILWNICCLFNCLILILLI